VAITTWEWSETFGAPVTWPEDVEFEADVRKELERTVVEVTGVDHRSAVTQRVVQGHSTPTLEEESRSAFLLVVGSRGRGEFAGMLLGSVCEFLATQAHRGVVIVRGD
jgi:nucleotide-binding universal stress UspA family protein